MSTGLDSVTVEKLQAIAEALKDASEHLDYCGYGDNWERECAEAQKLPEKVEKALKYAEELKLLS